MTLGYRIKEARKDAKLTQSQLAEKCGVATITIRQYESEKREPRLDTLRNIATALGVSIGYLQGYESKDAAKIVEAIKKSDMRTVENLMGLPEGSILPPIRSELETTIIDHMKEVISKSGPLEKLSDAEAHQAGFIQFNSEKDRIAFFYSRLNIDGKLAASRCFFKNLNDEKITEVADYVEKLSTDPQYQRKDNSQEE